MKILIVSDFYPPFIGGSYRHVQTLSRGLVKRGHEVVVCTIGNKYLNVSEEDRGVRVIRFEGFFQRIPFLFKDPKIKHPPPVQDFLISEKLKSIIKEQKPDIIHSHGWTLYSLLQLKKKLDLPLVVTLHDYGYICPKITFLNNNKICDAPLRINCISCAKNTYGLVKSLFIYYGIKSNKNRLKLVDKFIAVSSFVKEVYSKHLSLAKKIVVVPNFYEMKEEKLRLKKTGMVPDDFILFVGTLAPYKGVDLLIDAYKRLNTETELVLIGRSSGFSYKSTKNIKVIENASSEVVKEAYSKCKFLVTPSAYPDPCPTVTFEAMSHKKAVVASSIGGLKDIVVNGQTAILIPFNNSKKLTEAMDYLLRNPLTTNELGKNGFKRFKRNYTSDIIVPKIEKIYANLYTKNT